MDNNCRIIQPETGTLLNTYQTIIGRFYGSSENATARDILIGHSRAVADFALEINRTRNLKLDPTQVETAAMLHDIGIIRTHAPGIGCQGTAPYIRHGIIGADMLRGLEQPEWVCRIAERHTGVGITHDDIINQGLDLPTDRVMTPETLLEKLICYADKFYSKRLGQLDRRKTFEQVFSEVSRFGSDNSDRFLRLHKEFNIMG